MIGGVIKKLIVMSVLAALMPVCASAAGAKRYLIAFKDGTTPAQRESALKYLGASKADEVATRYRELDEAQAEVDRLYARWAELEEKRHASA